MQCPNNNEVTDSLKKRTELIEKDFQVRKQFFFCIDDQDSFALKYKRSLDSKPLKEFCSSVE